MSYKFRLDKKEGQHIGESNKTNPKEAAFEILGFALGKKGIEVKFSDINLTQIDEKTFEFIYADYELILSQNN